MNRYLNILFVLFLAIGVSSCAKEELENPSQTPDPQAIMKSGFEIDQNCESPGINNLQPIPVYINDDGDEEDEGLKPTIPTVVKN
ncbi:hypothetical protein G3O08_16540 [Cryomorpha ignava]|uniref:Lipoprotein n=1 Tax=Cryomorpha ignava TaxID=101383 RepID=A0A7K3WTV3_9FLAO|nr:hypothetical protein [Cryomorpha ignava]NEN25110.1 hypothetical protein [Cryomorpha ignava]